VTTPAPDLPFATRPIRPDLATTLQQLKPGQKIKITQRVRVGDKSWTTEITGTFRALGSLATGISTDRIPHDDIIVPTLHFIKENQELSSVTLDEQTQIVIL
jgi:hypothetical protein